MTVSVLLFGLTAGLISGPRPGEVTALPPPCALQRIAHIDGMSGLVSPDATELAAWIGLVHGVYYDVWRVRPKRMLARVQHREIMDVAYSPDGRFFLAYWCADTPDDQPWEGVDIWHAIHWKKRGTIRRFDDYSFGTSAACRSNSSSQLGDKRLCVLSRRPESGSRQRQRYDLGI